MHNLFILMSVCTQLFDKGNTGVPADQGRVLKQNPRTPFYRSSIARVTGVEATANLSLTFVQLTM